MSRTAIPAQCPRCQAPIITSTWNHAYNLGVPEIRADPTHITPAIETACIILDRPTINHWHTKHGHHLATRDTYWHRYHPHGPPTNILPAHQCGTRLPGTPINLTPPTPTPPPETCPF